MKHRHKNIKRQRSEFARPGINPKDQDNTSNRTNGKIMIS